MVDCGTNVLHLDFSIYRWDNIRLLQVQIIPIIVLPITGSHTVLRMLPMTMCSAILLQTGTTLWSVMPTSVLRGKW